RRRVGDHPVDVVLCYLYPQALLLDGVAKRCALDLHEKEVLRPVDHFDDVVEGWIPIPQEPGPEQRIISPTEVGHDEAEQPLPPFANVLSGHLLTFWQTSRVTNELYRARLLPLRSRVTVNAPSLLDREFQGK